MSGPTVLSGIGLESDVPFESHSIEEIPVGSRRHPSADRSARSCLALFLAEVLCPEAENSHSLAAVLFAHGAMTALLDREQLPARTRDRLEASLLQTIVGPGRRAARAWRLTLAELEKTPEGRALRFRGAEAARAWLRGESPAPHLEAALDRAS